MCVTQTNVKYGTIFPDRDFGMFGHIGEADASNKRKDRQLLYRFSSILHVISGTRDVRDKDYKNGVKCKGKEAKISSYLAY